LHTNHLSKETLFCQQKFRVQKNSRKKSAKPKSKCRYFADQKLPAVSGKSGGERLCSSIEFDKSLSPLYIWARGKLDTECHGNRSFAEENLIKAQATSKTFTCAQFSFFVPAEAPRSSSQFLPALYNFHSPKISGAQTPAPTKVLSLPFPHSWRKSGHRF
jgi:hypothetical protein